MKNLKQIIGLLNCCFAYVRVLKRNKDKIKKVKYKRKIEIIRN